MRVKHGALVFVFLVATLGFAADKAAAPPDVSMNATIIEACSCPMFCQCYFSSEPAGHAEHGGHETKHYCKFNNVFKVNSGKYGDVDLAGSKFWVAGDLGDNFSDMEMDWAVLTFDPAVTPAQREGIAAALGKLYPVKWKSFNVAKDLPIEWTATKEAATAKLDSGKAGEVQLVRAMSGMNGEAPVIKNLQYFGASSNDGFVLMPNTVEAYRLGDKAYEYKGTNGFMITVNVAAK
jgi:hypothetical protein